MTLCKKCKKSLAYKMINAWTERLNKIDVTLCSKCTESHAFDMARYSLYNTLETWNPPAVELQKLCSADLKNAKKFYNPKKIVKFKATLLNKKGAI